jgi:hypothetical protein
LQKSALVELRKSRAQRRKEFVLSSAYGADCVADEYWPATFSEQMRYAAE